MILTCPQCQSQYNLDPGKLGSGGRTVRCAGCGHSWFQPSEEARAAVQQAEAAFQAVLSEIGEGTAPVRAVEAVAASVAETAEDVSAAVIEPPPGPPPVAPAIEPPPAPPVITHNPFGVGPRAFGVLTFLFCVSLTLLLLILGRQPVARALPATALFYQSMGFDLRAPGEGLRLSEIVAEQRLEKEGRILAVEGKITNMSEHELAYPPLRVTLKNRQGEAVKEWVLEAGATALASGETVPLLLQLTDMPPDGATVDVRVRD